MINFNINFTKPENFRNSKRKPAFENLKKVLEKRKPDRPTLFEFFLNGNLHNILADENIDYGSDSAGANRKKINAFNNAGYDYVTHSIPGFGFQNNRTGTPNAKSISLNEGVVIFDRESFNNYEWTDAERADYSIISQFANEMPDGMKLIIHGPGGVLENVIRLVGYDNLCYMIADDNELAYKVFESVGSRFLRYYELSSPYEAVGAVISNDDWGFNTQTMLSVEDMRKFVIPWHKKIVQAIHNAGKPAILHSCGKLDSVMDDIVFDIGYDGKHSYEDKIMPIEIAYDQFSKNIALLGGIDVDFLCRSTPEEVFKRSLKMVEKSLSENGAYALGSGNSIPYYVPVENYLAMISAVRFNM